MLKKAAQLISILFHPVLLPTLGFILMFNSGFYFSFLSWDAQRFVLMVVFFTTAVLPMLAVALLSLNPKFELSLKKRSDRIISFLFTSAFYYLGYVLLNRIKIYPVFKILLIASVLVIIANLLISLRWKISSHMAAIGSLTGAFFALSFRTGINPVLPIVTLVLGSGIIASSRLILNKYNLEGIITGYSVGLCLTSLIIYFV